MPSSWINWINLNHFLSVAFKVTSEHLLTSRAQISSLTLPFHFSQINKLQRYTTDMVYSLHLALSHFGWTSKAVLILPTSTAANAHQSRIRGLWEFTTRHWCQVMRGAGSCIMTSSVACDHSHRPHCHVRSVFLLPVTFPSARAAIKDDSEAHQHCHSKRAERHIYTHGQPARAHTHACVNTRCEYVSTSQILSMM